MTEEILDLLSSLDVQKISETTYIGKQVKTLAPRTFGGQFLAHSIMAAGRSLKYALPVHSLSAHFVRGGDPHEPISYEVTTLRENRKYANTLVTASQKGDVLFTALIAFTANSKDDIEHELVMPKVPYAEDLPVLGHWLKGYESRLQLFVGEPKRVDWRYVNEPSWVQRTKGEFLDYNMSGR